VVTSSSFASSLSLACFFTYLFASLLFVFLSFSALPPPQPTPFSLFVPPISKVFFFCHYFIFDRYHIKSTAQTDALILVYSEVR